MLPKLKQVNEEKSPPATSALSLGKEVSPEIHGQAHAFLSLVQTMACLSMYPTSVLLIMEVRKVCVPVSVHL